MKVHIRWVACEDVRYLAAIEAESFASPWDEFALLKVMRHHRTVILVADVGGGIAGYVVYRPFSRHLEVTRLAVAARCRCCGVGRQLVHYLLSRKLEPGRRERLVVSVHECNLAAQLFMRQCGLRAVRVERGACEDGSDAFRFEYSIEDLVSIKMGDVF